MGQNLESVSISVASISNDFSESTESIYPIYISFASIKTVLYFYNMKFNL